MAFGAGARVRVREEIARWGGMEGRVERVRRGPGRSVRVHFDDNDVRSFGPAELVVVEVPYSSPCSSAGSAAGGPAVGIRAV